MLYQNSCWRQNPQQQTQDAQFAPDTPNHKIGAILPSLLNHNILIPGRENLDTKIQWVLNYRWCLNKDPKDLSGFARKLSFLAPALFRRSNSSSLGGPAVPTIRRRTGPSPDVARAFRLQAPASFLPQAFPLCPPLPARNNL